MARADVHPAGTISSPSSASMSASIVITNKQASRHVTDRGAEVIISSDRNLQSSPKIVMRYFQTKGVLGLVG